MKKIELIIAPFQLRDIQDALGRIGVRELNITELRGYDTRSEASGGFPRNKGFQRYTTKLKVECGADPDLAEIAIRTIEPIIADPDEMAHVIFLYNTLLNEEETEVNSYSSAYDVYVKRIRPAGSFVWKSAITPDPAIRSVTVVARDCPMIFAGIVGVLSLNDLDILDARSYRQDNNTLAIFKVRAISGATSEKRRLRQAEQDLRNVLAGRLNLGERFRCRQAAVSRKKTGRPCHVGVNNDNSFLFSVIEVSADDFPGILFTITDAIMRCGLDIWNAKIATNTDRIFDVFYVKDMNGRKISSSDKTAIVRSKIKSALTGSDSRPDYFRAGCRDSHHKNCFL